MDNRNNVSFWAIAFGVVAGGAAVYYLNTKEGREASKKLRKDIAKLEKTTRKALKQQSEMMADKANTVANATKTYVDEVSNTAKDKVAAFTKQTANTVNATQNSIENGINTAKSNIKSFSKN